MQKMIDSPADELAVLRARAYGPHADIHADAVALARLRELEDAERAALVSAVVASAPSPEPESGAAVEEVIERDPVAHLSEPPAVAAPTSPRPISTAWIVAWAASVLVVALVVGGMVFALASIRPVSAATGATQVASLTDPAELSDTPWVRQWFGGVVGAGRVTGNQFAGLIVAQTPEGMMGPESGSDCLVVMAADAYHEVDQSFQGQIYSACRAGAFPASVQFVVDGGSPPELKDRFGVGTALSFVLDGETVGVFADDGPTPAPTATTAD